MRGLGAYFYRPKASLPTTPAHARVGSARDVEVASFGIKTAESTIQKYGRGLFGGRSFCFCCPSGVFCDNVYEEGVGFNTTRG